MNSSLKLLNGLIEKFLANGFIFGVLSKLIIKTAIIDVEKGVGRVEFDGLSVVLKSKLISILSNINEVTIDESKVLPKTRVIGLKLNGGFGFGNSLLNKSGDLFFVFFGKILFLR